MSLFFVLMALVSSATALSQDMLVAIDEMQKANYFTFVMLINMAPPDLIQANITFLMPNDRTLSKTNMAETSVVDFLLRHSIPSPLLIDHLEHFPTGSMIPSSRPGFVLKVTNDGRRRFFLNNVRITSPNICTKGASIRCHGVDGVVQPTMLPQPNTPPSCPNRTVAAATPLLAPSPPGVGAVSPVPPPSVHVSPPKSTSPDEICNPGVVNLVLIISFMLSWLVV